MSITREVLEYTAAVAGWLDKRPEAGDFDALGEIYVTWHGERIGVFKDLDGWWEYFPEE